jgi:hypothetical protein
MQRKATPYIIISQLSAHVPGTFYNFASAKHGNCPGPKAKAKAIESGMCDAAALFQFFLVVKTVAAQHVTLPLVFVARQHCSPQLWLYAAKIRMS